MTEITKNKQDICALHTSVSLLLTSHNIATPPNSQQPQPDMDTDEQCDMIEERCITIKNLPHRRRTSDDKQNEDCDDEDIHALIYLGLNISDITVKSFKRADNQGDSPGIVTVELCSIYDKIRVLRKKLKTRRTLEYKDVFIYNVKSTNQISALTIPPSTIENISTQL